LTVDQSNLATMSGMVKQEQPKLEDTNMALYGSKVMTDLKKGAAETEPAWKDAGKAVGIQVWRIEKFKVVAWPKDQYGSFYNGDAYIILETYKDKDDKGKELDKLKYDIYFWLGKQSTQDERGTAAYKTVELDDLLDGQAHQHRVVESKESKHFLQLFSTLHIMEGGVGTGFNHVKPKEYKHRLLAVLGQKARFVKVQQVPLKRESLNDGEVFILDGGETLWQWQGKSATIWEKQKANELTERLVSSRNGKAKKKVLESTDDDNDFWTLLGGKGPIAAAGDKKAAAGGADAKGDTHNESWGAGTTKSLFQVKPVAGKPPTFTQIGKAGDKVTRSQLDSKNVYALLLQHGDKEHHIFMWVGKQAGKESTRHSMIWGVEFLKAQKLDDNWPISRVIEGNKRDAGFGKVLDG